MLTPSTVTASKFGLQFTDPIDGEEYAQPLYVPAVQIPGQGTHNVVYVATENDSVYAFDADAAGPPLWHTSFINPAEGITAMPSSDIGCNDLTPIIGITATPVIDSSTGTLYVVSKVKLGPCHLSATTPRARYHHRRRAGEQPGDDYRQSAGDRDGRPRRRSFL